jgi:uncharacterized protein YhfF
MESFFVQKKIDPRNSPILTFPSLIIDAKKPLRVKFGGTAKEQDELAEKVLKGEKSATSSLLYLQEIGEVSGTNVGDIWLIENSTGQSQAKVKVSNVAYVPFGEVKEHFALLEGDGSFQNWYQIHKEYYGSLLEKYGKELTDDTVLECVYFNLC